MSEKDDLINKLKEYLGNDLDKADECCQNLIDVWAEATIKFRSSTSDPSDCCSSTYRSLLHFFVEESFPKNYIATKNAMFGDLFEIRTQGFENRYLANTKLCRTYKAAYEKTEFEYKKSFSKRRYSSYDSFRQIRSRKMRKKNLL